MLPTAEVGNCGAGASGSGLVRVGLLQEVIGHAACVTLCAKRSLRIHHPCRSGLLRVLHDREGLVLAARAVTTFAVEGRHAGGVSGLRPRCELDLVAEFALDRPDPGQTGFCGRDLDNTAGVRSGRDGGFRGRRAGCRRFLRGGLRCRGLDTADSAVADSTGGTVTGDEYATAIGAGFGTGEEVATRVALGADGSARAAAGS